MTMAPCHPKRPRDPNQLGKLIVDLSTSSIEPEPAQSPDTPAVAFARLGGLRGGVARAATLSSKERKQIAKKAAAARWQHKRDKAP